MILGIILLIVGLVLLGWGAGGIIDGIVRRAIRAELESAHEAQERRDRAGMMVRRNRDL